jgi:mRNA-degrading endonuclease toxin of MazEF toxin-antitoxin module
VPAPKRGELYEIEILHGEHEGHELFGIHAYVVVSVNVIQNNVWTAVVVPLTSPINKETGQRKDAGDYSRFRKKIPEGAKQRVAGVGSPYSGESIALTEQVRVVDFAKRFHKAAFATLTSGAMAQIELGLAFVLGIPSPGGLPPVEAVPVAKILEKLPPEEPAKPVPGKPFQKTD